ncbi:MAG: DUF6029 family protein [Flavobacteriales bacterium]|nr:DUF6029 family protein [Flavobacteriales bacterium]
MTLKHILTGALGVAISLNLCAQTIGNENTWGSITGNAGIDMQYYTRDPAIGAPEVSDRLRMNSFLYLQYKKGGFTAGARYEMYLPKPLLGIDESFTGQGVAFRFASYKYKTLEVTAGSFYEQFGNGLAFRSYEARSLGFDNFIDGFRVKYDVKGVYMKGIFGRVRDFWSWSPGTVRGFDAEVNFAEIFPKMADKNINFAVGGNFVSKYQPGTEKVIGPEVLVLPQNVSTASGRANLTIGKFNLNGEFAYKFNDPSSANFYIYRPGTAALLTASFFTDKFGISVGAKRVDNFDFRSDREVSINRQLINWIPMLNKQHTYNLAASIYPYAVQPMGEQGLQADIQFAIPRGSKLGGKYGIDININASIVFGLDTVARKQVTYVDGPDSLTLGDRYGYRTTARLGKEYYRDFNIEISKKFNKKWKMNLMYMNLYADLNVLTISQLSTDPFVHAHIGVVDVAWRINNKHALRMELQGLFTKQDQGDWAMGLIEYTISPNYFISVMNQYNFGHPDKAKRQNYPLVSAGYNMGNHRFTLTYGRQRAGVLCIGGICRAVPAANGVTFSYVGSF